MLTVQECVVPQPAAARNSSSAGSLYKVEMAERVGFEPTERGLIINNLLKSLKFQYPWIPPRTRIWHLIWHQPKRS
jgi:hypothetical protein